MENVSVALEVPLSVYPCNVYSASHRNFWYREKLFFFFFFVKNLPSVFTCSACLHYFKIRIMCMRMHASNKPVSDDNINFC